jgi:hypothetical protein
MNNKGQGLSLNTIVIAAIVTLILISFSVIFIKLSESPQTTKPVDFWAESGYTEECVEYEQEKSLMVIVEYVILSEPNEFGNAPLEVNKTYYFKDDSSEYSIPIYYTSDVGITYLESIVKSVSYKHIFQNASCTKYQLVRYVE